MLRVFRLASTPAEIRATVFPASRQMKSAERRLGGTILGFPKNVAGIMAGVYPPQTEYPQHFLLFSDLISVDE